MKKILKCMAKIEEKKSTKDEETYVEKCKSKFEFDYQMYEKSLKDASKNIDTAIKIIQKNEVDAVKKMIAEKGSKLH